MDDELDEELRSMYARWEASDVPPMIYDIDRYDIDEVRRWGEEARRRFYPGRVEEVEEVRHLEIPGEHGAIPLRIVRPATPHTGSTVVFYHGGAWIRGSLDSHDPEVRRLANAVGAVVVSVGYRLAPEHRFPAAFDDAFDAYRWVVDNVDELGGDPARLAVAGDSAGGALASSVALAARDEQLPLAAQLLLYPPTDESANAGTDVVRAVLGPHRLDDPRLRDPRFSPAYGSLQGLAPVIIGVGSREMFLDDNLRYVGELAKAGVRTLLRVFPGLNHGFLLFGAVSRRSDLAVHDLFADLRRELEGRD